MKDKGRTPTCIALCPRARVCSPEGQIAHNTAFESNAALTSHGTNLTLGGGRASGCVSAGLLLFGEFFLPPFKRTRKPAIHAPPRAEPRPRRVHQSPCWTSHTHMRLRPGCSGFGIRARPVRPPNPPPPGPPLVLCSSPTKRRTAPSRAARAAPTRALVARHAGLRQLSP